MAQLRALPLADQIKTLMRNGGWPSGAVPSPSWDRWPGGQAGVLHSMAPPCCALSGPPSFLA